jgi:hypothetical protein
VTQLFKSVAEAEAHSARVRQDARERRSGSDIAANAKRATECAIADGYGPHTIEKMVTLGKQTATTRITSVEFVGVNPHNKYRNRACGGYASMKEARRAAELKLLEKAGQIRDLHEQVPYLLIPDQFDASGKRVERATRYVSDFVYQEREMPGPSPGWKTVVEDTKSPPTRTAEYVVKRKLMRFLLGIQIKET